MALSAGLTAAGLEVWDLGLCPTPCVAYLAATSEAIGGVMISASHNPPADNGIKFFGPTGAKLPSDIQQRIEAGIRGQLSLSQNSPSWGHHHHRPELVNDYLNAVQTPPGTRFTGNESRIRLSLGGRQSCSPASLRRLGG